MRIFHIIVKNTFYIFVLVFVGTYFFRHQLPGSEKLLPELRQEPNQYATSEGPIKISQEGFTALLTPQYEYEISGLVVTQYESDTWYDYSHKNDPFNSKDVCVIWGANIENDNYKQGDFSSGEFTCFWYFDDQEMFTTFDDSAISNNHLIPSTKDTQKQIEKARIGDQIKITGYLVTYEVTDDEKNQIIGFRGTSTTREDTGDGACEVVYVNDFQILKSNPQFLPLLHHISLFASIFLFIGLVILFFRQTTKKEA